MFYIKLRCKFKFWCACIGKKTSVRKYIDTDNSIIHIKTDDCYQDISKDLEEMFDSWNYDAKIPLTMVKNVKAFGIMRDKLGG